jgi:hypothetical protein
MGIFWQNIFPVILTILGIGGFATWLASWLQKRHEKNRLMYQIYKEANYYLIKFNNEIAFLLTVDMHINNLNNFQSLNLYREFSKSKETITNLDAILNCMKEIFKNPSIKEYINIAIKKCQEIVRLIGKLYSILEELKHNKNDKEYIIKSIKDLKKFTSIILDYREEISKIFIKLPELAFKEMKLIKEIKMTKSQVKSIAATLFIIAGIIFLYSLSIIINWKWFHGFWVLYLIISIALAGLAMYFLKGTKKEKQDKT